MQLPSDFRDLICAFNAAGVEYLIVGGYAMGAHGMPRYTGDIDLFFRGTEENAGKVVKALEVFGYTSPDMTVASLIEPGMIHYFGAPPLRVDLLNTISGVDFDEAWQAKVTKATDDATIPIIGLEHLIANKKASGRLKDQADLEVLLRAS